MNLFKITTLSTLFTISSSFAPSLNGYPFPIKTQLWRKDCCCSYDSCAARWLQPLHSSKENNNERGIMDIISMKVDIPEEVRDEIFKAEANTPAAKDRNSRIAFYATLALFGIALSSLNVFLSNVRDNAGAAVSDLRPIEDLGFGWVGSNPFASFFLLNKIGGGMALIAAGFGGTMVELEQRTKNENAEKIWKELQRRRLESSATRPKKNVSTSNNEGKKKIKNKKRLNALSEVILEEEEVSQTKDKVASTSSSENFTSSEDNGGGGILGKMKNFYDQADKMAASQALLLNKELEDRGLLEKITDESGLKVIGKEEASKLKKDSMS